MPGIVRGQRKDDDQQLISSNATSFCSLPSNDDVNGSVSCQSDEFWSEHRHDIDYNQLQKFWSELSPQARQDLLRIDKQTLFEQARKNMYCSRCNGLLLERFMQIVMYGKSLQHDSRVGKLPSHNLGSLKDKIHDGQIGTAVCQDETLSGDRWDGLTTTRDGALTLIDCYLYSKSLNELQKVFDSARAKERDREMLYPDACGGGGRGWISQGIAGYGRGHGTRETCALHTARVPCGALVTFWSALGEETQQSLLRMKEEDFIERLMYRFDSKRFCRDCRRNVIREFKELKELKRMRKELRCTSWFCVADTAFQYEVSNDAIYADWHQAFIDSIGAYHHFEWAVGSGEGKSDILEYENVGMNRSVQVHGLDLAGLSACYITLRAWKLDGRCTEFSVKAHALKGRQCVHCRLVVGDGYVTITRGESIGKFFEHAEEAEEDEPPATDGFLNYWEVVERDVIVAPSSVDYYTDDDSMDKDGNDLDGECSRPQKHAKSPELAREFLLDAATVIFKEQVEKAYREGTARQNAHSIFVCLALKLLEERVHVACIEIITLEKQMKLLEEEEKEKREEQERKERKRTKEREKKLRRKERLKVKEKKCSESSESPVLLDVSDEVLTSCLDEEANHCSIDSVSDPGDTNLSESASPGVLDESSSNDLTAPECMATAFDGGDGEFTDPNDDSGLFMVDSVKGTRRKWSDRRRSTENGAVPYNSEPRYYNEFSENQPKAVNGFRQSRVNAIKVSTRNGGSRFGQKAQCSSIRPMDRNELHSCGCIQQNDHRAKVEPHPPTVRFNRESRSTMKMESASDMSKTANRMIKFGQADHMRDSGRTRNKTSNYANALGKDLSYTKQVWEPVEPHKRYPRSNSDSDVTLRSCFKTEDIESHKTMVEGYSDQLSEKVPQEALGDSSSIKFGRETSSDNGFHSEDLYQAKVATTEENDLSLMGSCDPNGVSDFSPSSSSDNCSSCLSEGDTNTPSSHPNLESSSTSDSEDSSQQSDGRQSSDCLKTGLDHDVENDKVLNICGEEAAHTKYPAGPLSPNNLNQVSGISSAKSYTDDAENGKVAAGLSSIPQGVLPSIQNQNISFPVFQGPPSVGYYHPSPVTWSAAPSNGLMTYPHPSHYLLPSPFGYSLNGDSHFCVPYGTVPHVASPFMNSNQIPVYQPVPRGNCRNAQELSSTFKDNGVKDPSAECGKANAVNSGHHLPEVSSKHAVENANLPKLDPGNTGFSLFQFGGPVALPTYRSGIQSSDNDKGGCLTDGDNVCSKKEAAIEEYNLFAARNGIQFSIF